MNYLGDYKFGETIYFQWATNDRFGASVTRSTDGTISCYKDNGTTQDTSGITDTEDFDSTTGLHACTIDTSQDATFYARAADFAVVLTGAVIDGQTVNTVLATFSIENRAGSPEAGALEITYTVREDDEDSGTLMEGCTVWITSDEAGNNVIWNGVTDSNGVARVVGGTSKPWLDAGTYYFWRQKSGWNFDNPDSETFS